MKNTYHLLVPKLVWPVAVTSGVLLAVGIGGAWYVWQLQTASSDILAWNVTSIRAAEELEIGVREIRNLLTRFQLTGQVEQLDEIPKLMPNCAFWLEESTRLARSAEEQELIQLIQAGYSRFTTEFGEMRRQTTTFGMTESVRSLIDDVLRDQILTHTKDYLDFNERELSASSEQNRQLAQRLALGLLLIGICGATAGLLAGFGLARGIVKRIVQISLPIHDVAGQLNEVVGPISISDPHLTRLEDLDQILRLIAIRVSTVIERLRQREQDALQAKQLAALGQLAAGLAHELRNPLMSMKILVQSALSLERGQLEGQDLDVLDDEIARLEKLVSTFLDFARPAEPSKRLIDLAEVLAQTTEFISVQARARSITLHHARPADSILIEADAAQLRQVLLNLLLNALDAGKPGSDIWVTACTKLGESGAPAVATVSVSDNGHGLPNQIKDDLFEPFVSSKPTGIGLGLAICRHIIQAHGGMITASNRPGGGAVFSLELPVLQPEERFRFDADVISGR